MRKTYLLKLATVKQADLNKEIERAKKLRDSSIWFDLLKNSVKGGLRGGAAALMTGIGLGAPVGLIANTIPVKNDEEDAYIPQYAKDGIGAVISNPNAVGTIDSTLASGTKVRLPVYHNPAEAYITYGVAGAADASKKLTKALLKPGIGIGAGLGALYSLLTYAHRKAKAEKKLRELGIE